MSLSQQDILMEAIKNKLISLHNLQTHQLNIKASSSDATKITLLAAEEILPPIEQTLIKCQIDLQIYTDAIRFNKTDLIALYKSLLNIEKLSKQASSNSAQKPITFGQGKDESFKSLSAKLKAFSNQELNIQELQTQLNEISEFIKKNAIPFENVEEVCNKIKEGMDKQQLIRIENLIESLMGKRPKGMSPD